MPASSPGRGRRVGSPGRVGGGGTVRAWAVPYGRGEGYRRSPRRCRIPLPEGGNRVRPSGRGRRPDPRGEDLPLPVWNRAGSHGPQAGPHRGFRREHRGIDRIEPGPALLLPLRSRGEEIRALRPEYHEGRRGPDARVAWRPAPRALEAGSVPLQWMGETEGERVRPGGGGIPDDGTGRRPGSLP